MKLIYFKNTIISGLIYVIVFTQLGSFAVQARVPSAGKNDFDNLPELSSSEIGILNGFKSKLREFRSHLDEVDKGNKNAYGKAKNSSDQIKAALPELQKVVEGYVAKLKQSGNWNDNLDGILAQSVAKSNLSSKDKSNFLSSVRNMGGVRNILASVGDVSRNTAADVDTMTREAQRRSNQSNQSNQSMKFKNQFIKSSSSSMSAKNWKCLYILFVINVATAITTGMTVTTDLCDDPKKSK